MQPPSRPLVVTRRRRRVSASGGTSVLPVPHNYLYRGTVCSCIVVPHSGALPDHSWLLQHGRRWPLGFVEMWLHVVDSGSMLVETDRLWVRFGRIRATSGRFWADVGRVRANFDKHRATVGQVGPSLTDSGPVLGYQLTDLGPTWDQTRQNSQALGERTSCRHTSPPAHSEDMLLRRLQEGCEQCIQPVQGGRQPRCLEGALGRG